MQNRRMKEKKNRQKFEHNPPRPSYRIVLISVGIIVLLLLWSSLACTVTVV